jgi:hypothetical protein
LPEKDKPADFGGAVGNFSISSKVDKTNLTTDDVLNFKVTITGSGNLKLIEAPKLSLQNGLSSFDPQITDTITSRTTTISGSKIINYTITPRTAGDYDIPALSFAYFNPQSGTYTTLRTEPVKIHVKQGKNKPGDAAPAALTDIRDINTSPLNDLTYNSKPMLYTVGYWSMYLLPLISFVGVLVWKRREEELSKDSVLLRNKRANKVALKRLVTAQKLLQQNSRMAFYDEISKAIWLYLSDKLNIPLSTLSKEKAQEGMTARNIPYDLQFKTEELINECETSLYAPSGGSMQMNQTYQQAVETISKLEETFNA